MNEFEKKMDKLFGEDSGPSIEDLLPKAGKIDMNVMKRNGEILVRWMAARKRGETTGGQKQGNLEIIFELTPETFKKYILPADRSYSIPLIKNAKSYEDMIEIIRSKIPVEDSEKIYMKIFKREDSNKWNTVSPDDPPLATDETIPYYAGTDDKWVLQVKDFKSPESKVWGTTHDTDVYANDERYDKTLLNTEK